jgi:hypothetical protein
MRIEQQLTDDDVDLAVDDGSIGSEHDDDGGGAHVDRYDHCCDLPDLGPSECRPRGHVQRPDLELDSGGRHRLWIHRRLR